MTFFADTTLWKPILLWFQISYDALLSVTCMAVPTILVDWIWPGKILGLKRVLLWTLVFLLAGAAAFIAAIYTVSVPNQVVLDVIGQAASLGAIIFAFVLWPVLWVARVFPTPEDLEEKNRELERLNETLEARVRQRAGDSMRLLFLVNSTADAVIAVDLNENIIEWNAAAEKLYGYSRLEVMGRPIDILYPGGLKLEQKAIMDRIRHGDVVPTRNVRRIRKDGEVIDVSLTVSPILDQDGVVIGGSSIARNISAELTLQNQIQDQQRLLSTLTDAAPNGMVLINQSGSVIWANRTIFRLFGYSQEEIVGQQVERLVPEQKRSLHLGLRQEFQRHPTERFMALNREVVGSRKDGTEFPIEVGLTPVTIRNGPCVMASVVDITERHQARMDLECTNRELNQRNDEMEQFIYTVSHDLKSPLVTSESFLKFLKSDIESGDGAAREDSLRRLTSAHRRMRELIDDLLKLSRVGHKKVKLERVDAAAVLASVRLMIDPQLKPGDRLTVQNSLPHVVCDQSKLAQAFENLLQNALKHARVPGVPLQITVGCKELAHEYHFFVQDDGRGIDPEFQSKVFGLFQRLDPQSDDEGTGVGLTIVKRVAELHGGRTWLESSVGKGCCFWMALRRDLAPDLHGDLPPGSGGGSDPG